MDAKNFGTAGRPETAPPANQIEAIHSRLLMLTKQIGMNADRTQRVVDRLRGAQPSPAETAKPREIRSGALGAINDTLDEIEGSANSQTSTLDDLDKLA